MRGPVPQPGGERGALLLFSLRALRDELSETWPRTALLVLGLVMLDLLLAGPVSTVLDPEIRTLAASLPHPPHALELAHLLDHMGTRWLLTPLMLLFALLAARALHSPRPVLLLAATMLGVHVVVGGLKLGLARGLTIHGDPTLFVPGGQAFPSGHAANVTSSALLVLHLLTRAWGMRLARRTRTLAVLVPALMMAGISLYLGYHWFTDLLAGSLLGILVVRTVLLLEPVPEPTRREEPTPLRG